MYLDFGGFVATISSLVDRVRMELGDMGKTFVTQFVADGTTNRFKLHYSPLDATTVVVTAGGTDISSTSSVEEASGVLVTDTVPTDGTEMTVSGIYYRYFTGAELTQIVNNALASHSAKHVDSLGRAITVETLPLIEEYPVAVYATSLALYTLATDSSFDIDIQAPDGINIPRSERYRQLMEMVNVRKAQYQELCVNLGIGMFSIDVFTFRRVSKATGRYVPVYKPQEVDDRSYPQRSHIELPTYGDKPPAWPTEAGELTAYQGREYETTVTLTGDYTGIDLTARLLNQRGGVLAAQDFTVDRTDNLDNDDNPISTTLVLSLTADQTLRLALRTYWSVSQVVEDGEDIEIKGGNFFTTRRSEVIL
jgi:hypothetical protein